ncbi:Ldh family oxidoreductase, partial [bacterium]|nr:Ldh family oxidoreductase [bacterium]
MTKRIKTGPAESCAWVPFDLLERFTADVFGSLGVPADEARSAAQVLSESDRRGIDSHGVARLKQIYVDRIRSGQISPVCRMEIVREGPTTAVIDGHNGLGLVIAGKAMNLAMEKASRFGMGLSAVRRSNHYGIAGYYALMAAKQDQIGITGTNARPSVAPTFSVEAILGTNPLCFGMPTDEPFPFILDCATSVSQRGKIEVYARRRKAVPSGWVIGRDGRYRHDAQTI